MPKPKGSSADKAAPDKGQADLKSEGQDLKTEPSEVNLDKVLDQIDKARQEGREVDLKVEDLEGKETKPGTEKPPDDKGKGDGKPEGQTAFEGLSKEEQAAILEKVGLSQFAKAEKPLEEAAKSYKELQTTYNKDRDTLKALEASPDYKDFLTSVLTGKPIAGTTKTSVLSKYDQNSEEFKSQVEFIKAVQQDALSELGIDAKELRETKIERGLGKAYATVRHDLEKFKDVLPDIDTVADTVIQTAIDAGIPPDKINATVLKSFYAHSVLEKLPEVATKLKDTVTEDVLKNERDKAGAGLPGNAGAGKATVSVADLSEGEIGKLSLSQLEQLVVKLDKAHKGSR